MLHLLEFDKIKEQLQKHAATTLGKEKVSELLPFFHFEQVAHALEETDEALMVIRLKGQAPFGGIRDVRAAVQRSVIGGMLNENELVEIETTLHGARRLKKFIESVQADDEADVPILIEHCTQIEPCNALEMEIRRCIDRDGRISDDASPELKLVRNQLRSYESRIREKLEQLIRLSDNQKKLSDSIITIRNDRYVIPVKQEYRSSFGGIVHDQSASGQTLFIEPNAVVMINNQLREAQAKERVEIEKILFALSEKVASYSDTLQLNVKQLAMLDFIFAKAAYAKKVNATKPKLNQNRYLRYDSARHPLIPSEEVVPISLELGGSYDTIVITGPNTGGKTVTLKTVGLLTLMAQAGLHIPVAEGSEATVFEHIFADIGDEQSIEQSLSTFSSHMTNIVSILNHINERSLVLFDELGAGTDPEEGAALAIAILDHVHHIGARCVATTHYSELKAYAYNRESVINASVEFNAKTLKPTYKLLIGVPGRSNAFEISKRLGLKASIIDAAKRQVSSETTSVDNMIIELEKTKNKAERELAEAKRIRNEVEIDKRQYEAERQTFEKEKDRMLKAAEQKAKDAVEFAKIEAESIIKELREYRKNGVKEHKLIEAKKRLEAASPQLVERKQNVSKQKTREKFAIGDDVELTHLSQKGSIIEQIDDGEYLVQVGIMKVNVNASQLKKIAPKKPEGERSFISVKGNKPVVKTELDLRGKRYEDAQVEVDRYLDDAVLAGYSKVAIIHGKGTGALRKGVHELLQRHPNVKSIRLGREGEGGLGVTIVELR